MIPSAGGLASSLPLPTAAGAAAELMVGGGAGGGGGVGLGFGGVEGGGGSKFERATSEASTREDDDGLKKRKMLGEVFLDSNFEPRPREAAELGE